MDKFWERLLALGSRGLLVLVGVNYYFVAEMTSTTDAGLKWAMGLCLTITSTGYIVSRHWLDRAKVQKDLPVDDDRLSQ